MNSFYEQSFIFGPVPSRRLGRSLGIDVFRCKMCSFDCIYCECGPTECLSIERFSDPSPEIVVSQLKDFISAFPSRFDVITFSGKGEPTLYEPIGDLIEILKKTFPSYPVAVLTNGSLFKDSSVRKALSKADIVSPSLDAPDEALFRKINRPHPSLSWYELVEGLIAFRKEYRGSYRLEVLLLKGINDASDHLLALSDVSRRIEPDIVELTTLSRPGTFRGIQGLSREDLEKCATFFGDVPRYVVGDYVKKNSGYTLKPVSSEEILDERIMKLLSRRPCSLDDLADSLGVFLEEVVASVERLRARYRLKSEEINGKLYYFLSPSLS